MSTLAALEENSCVVLLGDVGMGKSFEIAEETARLRRDVASAEHAILSVDLKRRSAALIEREVFSTPEFSGWAEGRHDLTLLLDSMDECWRRVTELGPLIFSHLRPHLTKPNPRRLRLRLSCRGAEWQEGLESQLGELFRVGQTETRVQVWQIAPLTKENVRVAATEVGLDAELFLRAVGERDVDALAAHPITLRMLLDITKAGGALGRTRAEIYAAGLLLLCEDPHQVRAAPRQASTVSERLAFAAHVATTCVLSNRYLIFGADEHRPADESGMLVAADLHGRTAHMPSRTVTLDRAAIFETLQTALFDSQPNGVFTWRHQSYAEYLAARYLAEIRVPKEKLVQLLCDTSGSAPRIWPQLEETACWLVALVPGLFELMVGDNADVFVRCDPARLDSIQRSQIVAGYLNKVRQHEASVPHWSEDNRLNRLKHGELAAQLMPALTNKGENWLVRDVALDIVRACEVRELVPQLIEIMLTPDEVPRLRHSAGVTLRAWADENIRTHVRNRMSPAAIEDENDDVRGCVLSILWPSHLTVEELVPLLTLPKKDNYTGSYRMFFYGLADKITTEHLPALLRWVATVEPDSDHLENDPYDGACGKICLAAYRSLADPAVRREFFALLRSLTSEDGRLFSPDGRNLTLETPWRRLFWQEFMGENGPVRENIIRYSLREAGLIVVEDFEWVMQEIARAATPEIRNRWLELAFWIFAPQIRPVHLELMWPLVESDPAVADRIRLYTTEPLVEHGEPNWRKAQYHRERQQAEERAKRKPFHAQIDQALDLFVGGKRDAMWWLFDRLSRPVREPDEDGANSSEWGWKCITDLQRQRLVELAPGFIESTAVSLVEVNSTEFTYKSYQMALRLMLELELAGSSWLTDQSDTFWQTWTPVLFIYQDRVRFGDEESWPALFQFAYTKAREIFLAELERWLALRANRFAPLKAFSRIPLNDVAVEAILLQAAIRSTSENGADFELFSYLLERESKAAVDTLRSWQPSDGRAPLQAKAAFADALLVCYGPDAGREEIVERMLANSAWGKIVLGYLDSGGSLRSGWIAHLPAEMVSRIWEWLEAEFPGDPYETNHHGTVTLEHEVQRLRSGILTFLEGAGTEDAVEAIGGLVRRHSDVVWLGEVLAKARHTRRRREWKPPAVLPVEDFLASQWQTPLCSDGDLCDALVSSLGRYQKQLHQPTPATELWNEPAGPVKEWSPKDENNLSDCVARHFNSDLKAYGIKAVRESEIRQQTGSAPGDEPDIMVYAPSASGQGETLVVVVEVKCAWNTDTVSSVEAQLYNRYLRGLRCGIHLTGYFTCDSWSESDRRKRVGFSGKSREELFALLTSEKKRLSASSEKRVEVIVLDSRV